MKALNGLVTVVFMLYVSICFYLNNMLIIFRTDIKVLGYGIVQCIYKIVSPSRRLTWINLFNRCMSYYLSHRLLNVLACLH